jgi:uncharacterized membrane protein YjfL (UPF0719 family)
MNVFLLITGIVEIVLALVLGVLFIYAAFRLFDKLTKDIEEWEELKKNNTAVGILCASIILSVIYLIKNSVDSAATIFSNTLRDPNAVFQTYLITGGLMLLHIFITGLIGFFGVYIALLFFFKLTRDIDELKEIKNNNVAVAVLMAIVVFSIALLLQPGIKTVLDALIPYPEVAFKNIGTGK